MTATATQKTPDPPDHLAEIRVLGALTVQLAGRRIQIGDAKHRLMLAMLVAAEGRLVPTEQLIDQIWDDHPPRTARDLIHSYASDLRRCLEVGSAGAAEMLPRHHDGGYQLLVSRDRVDLYRFRDLVVRARPLAGHDDAQAATLLQQAMSLWDTGTHGEPGDGPLTDLNGTPVAGCQWLEAHRRTLREEHRATLIARLEAELRLGEHERLIAELADLATADPLDERIAGLLLIAYYRSGRQGQAALAYQRTRGSLLVELGVEPGQDLRNLYQDILRQDPRLDLPASRHPADVHSDQRARAPTQGAVAKTNLPELKPSGKSESATATFPSRYQLSSPDVTIRIFAGDLFDQETHLAVGFSDTFDTSVADERIIRSSSVQGQLLHRLFDGDQCRLDEELTTSLATVSPVCVESRQDKPHGKLARYPLGTVAVLGEPRRLIFAVAYGIMGDDLVVHAPVEELWHCYAQLWEAVYRHGQRAPLSIPLMGSGLARVDTLDRENLLRLILLSFVAYSRVRLICHELRIVIFPDDARRIDPVHLRGFFETL